MRSLKNLVIVLIGVAAFAMLGASAFARQEHADEAFEYRVCKLLEKPFVGSISFGGADGCEWGMSDPDGVTIENEKIRSTATGVRTKADLKTAFDLQLLSYQQGVASGAFKLQPLGTCEGGWQITSLLGLGHPVHMGFYRCNQRLINVETEGVKSVGQFDSLANKMVDLVK